MAPNPSLAIARYAELAHNYDSTCQRMEPIRRRTIDALNLRRGDVVFDIAAGTGPSFRWLQERIGPDGHIVAIEQSPHMMALARERVAAHRWRNVTLIEASVQDAEIPLLADAILFNYTHDVLRSRVALGKIFDNAQPGARVAVSGTKFFSWWLAPLNVFVALRSWRYFTTVDGLSRPYSLLQDYLIGWQMETTFGGMGYIGHGIHPGALRSRFAASLAPTPAWQRPQTSVTC